ncbi:chemotaxis protein CheA [uncultured Tateyamaria sp.]|uniref:chemotaxis protein CheA n=1 Tax=uncultured Tateyamaria sp. TaxID=455651 RepID=UPI002620C963|nr:chemotaxis protein CheA [uncultured Tateyamaria sp.]
MTTPDPMAEIRASFFVECDELLEAMQDGLQALEDGTDDAETIHVVFRAVHSIKGGAGAFGLEALVRFSHHYESVLDRVRSGELAVDIDLLKHFFRAADHLSDLVRANRDGTEIPSSAGDAILAEMDAHIGAGVPPDEVEPEIEFQPLGLALDLDLDLPALDDLPPAPQFKICFAPDAEMFETGNDVFPILRSLAALGTCDIQCDTARVPALSDIVPETSYLSWTILLTSEVDEAEVASVFEFVEGLCKLSIERLAGSDTTDNPTPPPVSDQVSEPLPEPETDSAEPEQAPQRATPAAARSVVRVDLDRIERLVNLVGELVINQAMLAQSLQGAGLSPHSDAMNGLEEFQRLTRDIQDSVMMIRAQPVKPLFQRMSRIVREASAAVNKDVRLITDGDATEVDKTVIERLADPLTHMIRNAVDHGLEPTHERVANGKDAQGRVTLSAAHRSGRVIIEVSDDGGGINRPRVLQIAMDKGLIPTDATLSDSEIDNLLFLPGFSTADTVSDLSGRGVGMDVVRTAIQSLGGRISITSTPGLGTNFSISLPLTLAVLDGMVIEVADETLVLPLNVVAETVTLSAETLDAIQPGLDVVRVRDGLVPLFDLGYLLGYRARKDSYVDGVALLITHDDGSLGALVVDEIQDQRQVVIKGLDDTLYRAPGIAAATILGDGQIALIVDPSDIIARAGEPPHAKSQKIRMES